MNVIEEYFIEMIKYILTMTFTGSIVSVFLFVIKPVIKDKMPKSFQYYMWFPVIIALILPFSKIMEMPAWSSLTTAIKSPHDIAQWIAETTLEKPANVLAPQPVNELKNLQTTVCFPGIASILFAIWQFGAALILGFNIVCYILYVRKLKRYNLNADQQEIELLNELSGSRIPRLYKNPIVTTPVLIGVICPKIILPDKNYEDMKLQSILLHEITHMRKYDIAIKWLLIYAAALHWFNPITYFVCREVNKACELACDEYVIRKFDNDGKQNYGDALIAVAADTIRKIPISITMFEDKKNLKERLGAIMKHKDFSRNYIYLSAILIVLISCATFYLGVTRSSMNLENGGIVTSTDTSLIQRQKLEKEIEIKQALCDYDQDNIVGVWAAFENSDREIVTANIFVVSKDEIVDVDEKNKIKAIVSHCLNLDDQNISLEYMGQETFISQGTMN